MRLQNKLDAFKAKAIESGRFSQSILEKFAKGTKELIESGQVEQAVKAGDKTPLFNLPDADGVIFSSSSHLARGPLVVTFYRGVWCPYCNLELQALEAARGEIESRGATLVALSMQNASNRPQVQARESARLSNSGGLQGCSRGPVWSAFQALRRARRRLQAIRQRPCADQRRAATARSQSFSTK